MKLNPTVSDGIRRYSTVSDGIRRSLGFPHDGIRRSTIPHLQESPQLGSCPLGFGLHVYTRLKGLEHATYASLPARPRRPDQDGLHATYASRQPPLELLCILPHHWSQSLLKHIQCCGFTNWSQSYTGGDDHYGNMALQ